MLVLLRRLSIITTTHSCHSQHLTMTECNAAGITNMMRSYKSYFALILVPYLFLIFIFHTQLQTYDNMPQQESHLNERDVMDPILYDKQANRNNSRNHRGGRFSRRRNLSHDGSHRTREWNDHEVHDDRIDVGLDKADLPLYIKKNISFPQLPNAEVPHHMYGFQNAQLSYCGGITAPIESNSVTFQPVIDSFVYSAYYDNRKKAIPAIRIITVLRRTDKPAFFCHIPKRPGDKENFETVVATYYEMCENHGKDYGGWMLSCEMPDSIKEPPCSVILSLHSDYKANQPGNFYIPVILLEHPTAKKADFALCVPPLFGYIPSTTLIEFVELSKILGADHIVFYAHHIPREVQKVLHYYENIGVATVIPWDLPLKNNDIWYHGQLIAINDCLYRNMHRFTYLAFNDIDEFVVPHKHSNWSEMVRHLHNLSGANLTKEAGYSFQSAFFDPLIESSSRVLYDLESDLRTKSFSKVRTKVMVDSANIYELGIHHISRPIRDSLKPNYVSPEVAFLHHYRKCVTDYDPRMNCQVFARDESISRYIPTLRHNVHQTLWILKETEKLSYRDRYMLRR